MQTVKGIPIAPGYAQGQVYVYLGSITENIVRRDIVQEEIEHELNRLKYALNASIRELQEKQDHLLMELGKPASTIFEAHIALLNDEEFITRIKSRIGTELINAEYSVELEIEHLKNMLSRMKNEYLRERTYDIRDVGQRIQKYLQQQNTAPKSILESLPEHTVLVAHELLPSDTLYLDREHTAAIVTESGGMQSHAAILARALDIPFVAGIQDITTLVRNGDHVLVDAEQGHVTLSPSSEQVHSFNGTWQQYRETEQHALDDIGHACNTRDGVRVKLRANIGRVAELSQVQQYCLEGIGLFRTEYIFFELDHLPDFHTQQHLYQAVYGHIPDLPVVMRTLDLGGDKHPSYLDTHHEHNPNLGFRGLRFSLAHPDILETQLRAMLEKTGEHDIRILFPMVLGVEDLQKVLHLFDRIVRESGLPKRPPVGAMIETPSAVLEIERIVTMVDFISIGTNDLTQFMLAADRNSLLTLPGYSALQPAVLKAVAQVISAARQAACPACICGEAAGEPDIACLFTGMGIRELSMSPVRSVRVRQAIRQHSISDLDAMAEEVLSCATEQQVKNIISERRKKHDQR